MFTIKNPSISLFESTIDSSPNSSTLRFWKWNLLKLCHEHDLQLTRKSTFLFSKPAQLNILSEG
jgi:hypothetical protein